MPNRRRKSRRHIGVGIGEKTIDSRILAAFIVAGAAALAIGFVVDLAYIKPKREAERLAQEKAEAEKYLLKGVSEQELEDGNFYINTGDKFYKVNAGALQISDKSKMIAEKADSKNRLLLFGKDDTLTPTMYEDSTLVYKAAGNEASPDRFTIERFKDEGWTLGMLHLSDPAGNGKIRVNADVRNFYPGSSITALKIQQGDDVTIDKIGGSPMTDNMLSDGGTILNLQKDAYYQVDAYRGSDYIGLKAQADVHALTSWELYQVPYYSMNKANYWTVKFPALLQNGYYYVQGKGCFRYVHAKSTDKRSADQFDYNVPYYVGSVDSESPITNPVEGLEDTNSLSDAQSSYAWRFPVDVPDGQQGLGIGITYTNIATDTDDADNTQEKEQDQYVSGVTNAKPSAADAALSTPGAVVEDPDGKMYKLDLTTFNREDVSSVDGKTYDEGILSMYTDSPKAGRWIVHMSGMYGRQYAVETSTTPVNTDGTLTGEFSMRVDSDLEDATFHFTWDNTDRTAVFDITTPAGEEYSTATDADKVTNQSYGMLDFHIGEAKAGNYKVAVRGGNLGKIRYTYTDAPTEGAKGQDNSGQTSENGSTEAAEASSGEAGESEKAAEATKDDTEKSSGSSAAETTGAESTKVDTTGIIPRGGMQIDGTIFDAAPAD